MDNMQQTQFSFIHSKFLTFENKTKIFSVLKSICKPALGKSAHAIRKHLLLPDILDPATTSVIKITHEVIYTMLSPEKV